ncbi:hypothetical protein UT300012_23210 [Paraclostridium bifermentans]
MSIRRAENDNNFLEVSALQVGEVCERIGYLQHIKEGRVEGTGKGYFTLYLKDCHGNVVVGRMFDIDRFEERGLEILALKGKPVRISFRVSVFMTSISLDLHAIAYYGGPVDYSQFIGKYEGTNRSFDVAVGTFRKLLNKPELELPPVYKNSTIRSIYEGRVGGYTYILESVVLNILGLRGIANVDVATVAEIFYIVQDHYYNYLKRVEDLDFVPLAEKLGFLTKMSKDNVSENLSVAIEVMTALLDLGKPETVLGHLIYDYITSAIDHINMLCTTQTMVTGMVREVGGRRLVKL